MCHMRHRARHGPPRTLHASASSCPTAGQTHGKAQPGAAAWPSGGQAPHAHTGQGMSSQARRCISKALHRKATRPSQPEPRRALCMRFLRYQHASSVLQRVHAARAPPQAPGTKAPKAVGAGAVDISAGCRGGAGRGGGRGERVGGRPGVVVVRVFGVCVGGGGSEMGDNSMPWLLLLALICHIASAASGSRMLPNRHS